MTTDQPGSQLLSGLLVLTALAREWQRAAREGLPATPFEALHRGLRELGHRRAARPLPCPDRYRQAWQAFLTGRRRGLDAHAIRHLCWHADAATDIRFLDYLDRKRVVLGPRSLQGLVHACHARWSDELAEGSAVRAVWRRVASYEGQNPLLLRWQSALPMILGAAGPAATAKAMVHRQSPIQAWCEAWGLDEGSPYVQESVRHAAQACREQIGQMGRSASLTRYLLAELLPWSGWRVEDFLEELAAIIIHPQASSIWEPLTHLVLHDPRLGDPRLPENDDRWTGIPEVARRRMIQWLSRAGIEGGM
jgi:hypothetical protein